MANAESQNRLRSGPTPALCSSACYLVIFLGMSIVLHCLPEFQLKWTHIDISRTRITYLSRPASTERRVTVEFGGDEFGIVDTMGGIILYRHCSMCTKGPFRKRGQRSVHQAAIAHQRSWLYTAHVLQSSILTLFSAHTYYGPFKLLLSFDEAYITRKHETWSWPSVLAPACCTPMHTGLHITTPHTALCSPYRICYNEIPCRSPKRIAAASAGIQQCWIVP